MALLLVDLAAENNLHDSDGAHPLSNLYDTLYTYRCLSIMAFEKDAASYAECIESYQTPCP